MVIPNSLLGVNIYSGAKANIVGGTAAGVRNVISGNASQGVGISGVGTDGNLVQANTVGLNSTGAAAIPNAFAGIAFFNGPKSNQLGGTSAGLGNVISGNASEGVQVFDAGSIGNSVRGNSIFANAGLGINLMGGNQDFNGVTARSSRPASPRPFPPASSSQPPPPIPPATARSSRPP